MIIEKEREVSQIKKYIYLIIYLCFDGMNHFLFVDQMSGFVDRVHESSEIEAPVV